MNRYALPTHPALCLLILLALITALSAPLPLLAAESAATVVSLRGKATAINAAGQERPLAIKEQLFVSDRIKTEAASRLQILFTDNTIVSLGSAAEMAIAEYQWSSEQAPAVFKTRVEEGAFRVMGGAITKAAPERFTTETPSATIGIRGSMYAGRVSDGALAVVFQGGAGIYVQNAAGIVEITEPGFGTKVTSPNAAPAEPVAFTDEDMGALGNGLANGEGEGEGKGKGEGEGEAAAGEEKPQEEPAPTGDATTTDSTGDTTGDWADTTFDEPPPTTTPITTVNTTNTTVTTVNTGEIATSSSQDTVTQEAETTAESTTSTSLSGRGVMTLHDKLHNTELYYRYGSASASRDSGGATTVTVAGYQLPFTFNWSTSGASYSGIPTMVEIDHGTAYSLNIDGQIFDNYWRYLKADNLGEFFYLHLYDDMVMQDFEHESLIYAGIASTAGQMPTTGVDNYIGHLGGKSIPVSPETHYDGFVEHADMEVNWANRKFIGVIHDDDISTVDRRKSVFFFGSLTSDRDTAANVTVIGRDNWDGNDLKSDTIYSTSLVGSFYGSEYQGFGGYGSGASYSAYTSTQTESWDIATGMFRDPADHTSTSPTGSSNARGFIVGVAKGFNFYSTPTAVTPLVFRNPAPDGLQVTLNAGTGRVYGTASASGDSTFSLQNIYVGNETDNAYSAYVMDDNFIALLSSNAAGSSGVNNEGTYGDLKANQNFAVTAEPDADNNYATHVYHQQFSQHVTWGYWAVAFEDPLDSGASGTHYNITPEHAYWVAGELTPQAAITSLTTAAFQGTYTGPAYGSQITNNGNVAALTGGATSLNVNFTDRSISGSINFDQANLALVSGNFSADGQFNITGGNAFTVGGVAASAGGMSGAFFGDQAQAVAGSFDVTNNDSTDRYVGIFGGAR